MESAGFGALLYLKEDKHTFVGDANYLSWASTFKGVAFFLKWNLCDAAKNSNLTIAEARTELQWDQAILVCVSTPKVNHTPACYQQVIIHCVSFPFLKSAYPYA
jgi:hypothetical protein